MSRTTGENTSITGGFLPLDLLIVVAVYVLTACTIFVPLLARTPIRPVFGFLFSFFIPGYVLVSILFPRHHSGEESTAKSTSSQPRGLDWVARFVFSFGASLAIVTLVGIILGATPVRIRPVTLFLIVSVLLGLGIPLATYRRSHVPASRRIGASLARNLRRGFDGVISPKNTVDSVMTVVLVAVILISSGVVVYGGSSQNGEITEFALLSEDEDGEFVATEYPSTLQRGEPQEFSARINNQEGEQVSYTIVVLLRDLDPDNSTVVRISELGRFQETVDDNETWRLNHSVVPDRTGDDLQLQYLLYRGEMPERPPVDEAYLELHIWVDVTE
jgi:uncharacterized membrane protein